LKSESCEGLNIVGFRVGEEIRKAERDLKQLRQSLSRHTQGSPSHATIFSKLQDKEGELDRLRASERSISAEQTQRKDRKKLTVF
jgi:multidrug resistance efflux pump